MTLNDPARRALRTFLQAFIGVLLPALAGGALLTNGTPQMLWSVLLAAIGAGVAAVLSFTQNQLEDNGTLPALMKNPAPVPSSPSAPTHP